MASSQIKNIVFDVGNVIVRWAPLEIMRLTFGDGDDPQERRETLFRSETWKNLNKGLLTEAETKLQFQLQFGLSELECERLFYYIRQAQCPIYGTQDLIQRVKACGYQVYALTDNVREIVAYLKTTFDFWPLFDGAIVSAEEGVLKPQPQIYRTLLTRYQLVPQETVFLDDVPLNVTGAQALGMKGIVFENAAQCEKALVSLGCKLNTKRADPLPAW